jgi:hypothetical protein
VCRFPFLVISLPKHCGYPGFTLSCTHTNDTMLKLPILVKLSVKWIDYKSQVIQLSDPNHYIPRQLCRLNLSSSPFQFKEDSPIYPSYYRPLGVALFRFIHCLSSPNHQVYAFNTCGYIKDYLPSSCTKMYTL